ncbi:flagellar biosynthesis protein FlhF [Marinomonas algicola]|uniref:flagellar biosynthesis protein FlhF n=1 Tax=Marinomonas algicola TaxID=2773454 RepID=UPI00174BBCB2|nr:flagellar biosynthesis protein FlhF [Marinomonas algicola]
MQIRRFRAPDMRQAIRKVRDAVGPDAVILSNQRLPSGEIEIVAALDYDGSLPTSLSAAPEDSRHKNTQRPSYKDAELPRKKPLHEDEASLTYKQRIESARQRSNDETTFIDKEIRLSPIESGNDEPKIEESLSITNSVKEQQFKEMEQELREVKALLQNQKNIQTQQGQLDQQRKLDVKEAVNPELLKVRDKLKGLGISENVISRLLDDIDLLGREDDWNRVLAHLADHIPTRVKTSELLGCIAFMGPTGVGKTTTIGKIAAQHVLKYGNSSVVLVTTDTYRIAAHEQLRTFGRILGVPVVVVNEYSDLNDVLDKYADYSLVLVDTAGMNPRDRNLERQLLMINRARPNLKKLLVLPCTSQRQVLKTVVDVYSKVRLDGCVLSKLDESASLGEAISVIVEENLPVVYVADGQRIPDDIQPARSHNLVSRAVYVAEQYSHLYSSLKYGS